MLPKPERFTKKDFEGVRPKVFFRGELFDVALVKNGERKVACVISKKTLKKAVDRNKTKRRLLSALQKTERPNESFVFYPKKQCKDEEVIRIIEDIKKAFATL